MKESLLKSIIQNKYCTEVSPAPNNYFSSSKTSGIGLSRVSFSLLVKGSPESKRIPIKKKGVIPR